MSTISNAHRPGGMQRPSASKPWCSECHTDEHLIVESIEERDFTVVQGAVLTVTAIVVLINVLVDTLYAIIDPRIALSEE